MADSLPLVVLPGVNLKFFALGLLALVFSHAARADYPDQLYVTTYNVVTGIAARVYHLSPDGTYQVLSVDPYTVFELKDFSRAPEAIVSSGGVGTYVLPAGATRDPIFDGRPGGPPSMFSYSYFVQRAPANPRENVSLRATIGPSTRAIAGLILTKPQWAVIRVSGPALNRFGVTSVCSKTKLTLYHGPDKVASVVGWDAAGNGSDAPMVQSFRLTGAFPFEPGSGDSAMLKSLEAGAYTIHAEVAEGGTGGECLIEVYYLPYE